MVYVLMVDLHGQIALSTFGISRLALAEIILPNRSDRNAEQASSMVMELRDPSSQVHLKIASRLNAAGQSVVPLVSSQGQRLGVLCALDTQERRWDEDENVIMNDFAQLVVTEVELTTKIFELEQVRTALADKHEVLRTLIDTSPDYIFVKDCAGRFIISNRAHAQAAGIADPDLLIGKTASETFPAELAEQFNSDDLSVVQSGEPLINIERLTLDPNGDRKWVLTSKVPLVGADGTVRGLVGISRDITARKMAEQALRDREEFVQKVIATSAAMIFIYDLREQRNIYSSIALHEVLGYTPDDLLVMDDQVAATLIHPDDYAHLPQHLAQLAQLEDNKLLDLENRVRHRNGEYRWLFHRHSVFKRDNDGSVRQIVATVVDITRMKNAEAALRESDSRMRTLLNIAPVILVELDANAQVTLAEGEGIRRLGLAPQDLVGRDLMQYLTSLTSPDSKFVHRLQTAYVGETVDFILDYQDAVFQFRFIPSLDLQEFKVTGVRIIGIDVTEQMRARDALVGINGRLSQLRKIDTDLTARLDEAHVIQTVLDSVIAESGATHGCLALVDGDALRVHGVWGDIPGDSLLVRAQVCLDRALDDGRACVRTLDGHDATSNMLPGQGLRMVLPLIYGEKISGVIVLENATARRHDEDSFEFVKSITLRAAAALENARLYSHLNQLYERVSGLEQLKTDMIRIAAHDLRNPLTSLKGYLTLLAHDMSETLTTRQQDYLMMMEQTAQSMQRIISEILSLQRIEAIHDDVVTSPVEMTLLVRELSDRYEWQAAKKSITLQLEVEETPIYLLGDEAQLREAVENLLHNAIKYTPENGRVCIRLHQYRDRLHFEVEDTGYGIPAEQQARLFQPFYRAKIAATRHIEGTGLGLHLVKKIIERHKGQIHFRSLEGVGSTFGFEIPVSGDGKES